MGASVQTVLADKAYATGVNRDYLRKRVIGAVVPEKTTEIGSRHRKGSPGGRPPKFGAWKYKDRNAIERAFDLRKQWRGLATRQDKLAVTYRADVLITAILTRSRAQETHPNRLFRRVERAEICWRSGASHRRFAAAF